MEGKFAKNAYWDFLVWSVCSSLGITVCTLIDAILVGNFVGSEGLAVVNITTPVFLTYSLLGLTIGVGANVLIGRNLGASHIGHANRIFQGQILTGLLVGVFCMILSVIFCNELCFFLGANDSLFPLAVQYLTVVFFSSPLFIIYHILSASVRTDGDPKLAAISSAVVIFTNLFLDLLFLKGLGWGIAGASASLSIAETMGILVLLFHFAKKHALLKLGLAIPRFGDIKDFVINGFGVGSAFIFQAITMLIFNVLLIGGSRSEGVLYVAVFGVIYTMSMIPFAVFDGSGNAISSVVSIFVGEKDAEGILVVLRQGIKVVGISGAVVSLLFLLGAEPILRAFGIEAGESLKTSILAFRIFSASVLFTGINTLVSVFWQAIGRAKLASVMSIVRNFLLMLLLGFLLIPNFQIIGLSISYLASEIICFLVIISVMLFKGSKTYVWETHSCAERVYEKYYTIEKESIAQVATDLEKLCKEWEIGFKQAYVINLIAEELILNIIKFGLKNADQTYYISFKLLKSGGDYIIRIRDNVSTYNPFDSSGDAIDHGAIKLITKMTKYKNYQRKLIFNYLYLIV